MSNSSPRGRRAAPFVMWRGIVVASISAAAVLLVSGDGAASSPDDGSASATEAPWTSPWPGSAVETPFEAPAHEYGPGHRGVELRGADPGVVRAPADGIVAFAGPVAGREVLTIDHGDGLVTTLEPVVATVVPGDRVVRGDIVGHLSVGGDTAPGALHFGVRRNGTYINPMLLIGTVERAVLLPCC